MKNFLPFVLLLCSVFLAPHLQGQQLIEYQTIAGVEHTFQHETFIGGGAAFFDYDNDGDDDLYLTSGNRPDIFYVNNGDGTFTDQTNESGFFPSRSYNTMGVITGDIDNDGFKDVFVTTKQKLNQSFGKNLLFHNNGDGTFSEIWPEDAPNTSVWSVSATFFDYNLDGLLDIYIGNYVKVASILRGEDNEIIGYDHQCFGNQLYKNMGNKTFSKVGTSFILEDKGCALATTASDFDGDGDLDLIIANDFGPDIIPNRLFRNERISPAGTGNENASIFREIGASINANQAIYGMGISVGDYDNDLDLDYYITNNGQNILLDNTNGQFSETAVAANLDDTWNVQDSIFAVGWGCSFLDIDNDSDLDMYVSNGFVPGPSFLPTNLNDSDKLFINNGDATYQSNHPDYTIDNPFVSRGMAYSDIDNDGDLDIISIVQKAPFNATRHSKLFLNQLNNTATNENNNWLQIQLVGQEVNRDAYGSKVYLYAGGKSFLQELSGGASHCSHNSSILHFGLHNIEIIDSLKIVWTGGFNAQRHYEIPINQRIVITENNTDSTTGIFQDSPKSPLFLFPNPTNFQLHIDFSDFSNTPSPLTVSILSISGKVIMPAKNIDALNKISTINTSTLPAGVYLLKVTSSEKSSFMKFVKN